MCCCVITVENVYVNTIIINYLGKTLSVAFFIYIICFITCLYFTFLIVQTSLICFSNSMMNRRKSQYFLETKTDTKVKIFTAN